MAGDDLHRSIALVLLDAISAFDWDNPEGRDRSPEIALAAQRLADLDGLTQVSVDQQSVTYDLTGLIVGAIMPITILIDNVAKLKDVGHTEVIVALREVLDRIG